MKVSYKWLQTFFTEPLPKPEVLAQTSNFKIVEVEGTEEIDGDTIFDFKILADRAAYMLCHRGLASEFAATLDLKLKDRQVPKVIVSDIAAQEVKIENDLCRRYTARRVENAKVGESPEWLKTSLAKLGQRSINNIVDLANFVMFDIGQPLHAFDADKVEGGVVVRLAKPGEKLETLDNRQIELKPEVLVIADSIGPLAIAGVKGGKRAEVTSTTKNLILESANFDPSSVRKTSTGYSLRTDASKHYENNPTADLCLEASDNFSALIAENCPEAKFSAITDVYPKPEQEGLVTINPARINERLGVEVPVDEQKKILARMGLGVGETGSDLKLTIPTYRRDLAIPEDFAEEIGRIWGYDKLPETLPQPVAVKANKEYYYTEKLRNTFRGAGFSEVYLYSLVAKGELEVELPLAEDKKCYRSNLTDGLQKCLASNRPNLALLDSNSIDIFEIGHVFVDGKEKIMLGIASTDGRRVAEALAAVESFVVKMESSGSVIEIDWGAIVEKSPESASYDDLNIVSTANPIMFKQYSLYPFVLRDVAMWTPVGTQESEVEKIIESEGGEWLTRATLFDTFSKDNKISYAFRLVFQSMERTLTDADVNAVMARITKALTKTDFVIR
ncbi:MAG TPA: phenylalanine--tRNA ligase subunit beta [Candidatus Paceibacterota bacterium]